MVTKLYTLYMVCIFAGICILVTGGKKYYKGAMRRDLKFNVMGGKRWIGTPALIIGLFNVVLAVLLIIVPLCFIMRDLFFT